MRNNCHQKTILGMLFALILLLNLTPGKAEDFSIRKGVCFGDSKETVLEKIINDNVDFEEKELKDGTTVLSSTSGIVIAGIEDVNQYYYFDKEGKLFSARYEMPYTFGYLFSDSSFIDIANYYEYMESIPLNLVAANKDLVEPGNMYYELISRLSDKYGTPLTVDSSAFEGKTLNLAREFYKAGIDDQKMIKYTEWLLSQNDGSAIKIECTYVGHNIGSNTKNAKTASWYIGYRLAWGYEYISEDTINKTVNDYLEKESAIYDDL